MKVETYRLANHLSLSVHIETDILVCSVNYEYK